MTSPSLSRCGLFVAVLKEESIQVHSLSNSSSTPTFFNLRKVFLNYRKHSELGPSLDSPITVHQIDWERVLPGCPSSKYAVSVSCGSSDLVVVFEVSGGEDPAVIEVDALGIDHFEWFPAIPGSALGSYSNSTMLAVFSRLNLHLKVYSLLCTQALVTVAKPCSHVIFHPHKPCLWSVVAQPYYAKNSAARRSPTINPRLSHFYTDGVTCTRLVSLELSGICSSAASWEWSQSGKWLSLLDPETRLTGPDVRVYNLYGIHQRGNVIASHVTDDHVAHPTLVAAAREPGDFGSLWGLASGHSSPACDYILKYREPFDSGRATSITTQIVDIQSLSQGKPQEMVLSEGVIWSHFRDLDLEIKYSRLARLPPADFRWTRGFSFGASHVIASDKNVCIFRRSSGRMPQVEPKMCVFGDSKFLDVYMVNECFVVAYSDHVSVLHAGAPQIVATSRYSFTSVSFTTDGGNLAVSLVENTPGGPLWRRVLRPLETLTSKGHPLANDTLSTEHEVTDTFQNKRR